MDNTFASIGADYGKSLRKEEKENCILKMDIILVK